jgi:Cytochrome P460
VYIGTPVTPNDMNGGEASFPEFHEVYMDPESFAHYEKTGKFRDGTVLVKELSSVGSKEAPSGKGYFQGEFTGLEATIKDSKRFKDEPGYWAYFSFGHKYPLKAEVAKGAVAACNKCHQDNAQKDDWVFSQDYPVLRAAAPKSK